MSPSPIPLDTRVTIGAFARVTRISARTLRKYDALGIIRPAFVDPDTGYRYYTMRQYPLAETIRMLRSLDVPLGEVRAILQADRDAGRRLLERHLTRVNERIDRERRTVTRLESALAHGGAVRAYHCEVREVAARPVISLTISSPRTGINAAIAAALDSLTGHAAAKGLTVTGREIVVYDFDPFMDDDYRADVCLPLESAADCGDGPVRALVLPACTAAATVHHGPDDDLQSAYASLLDWIAEHDLEIVGHERETYPVDERDTDDPRRHVTEIMWPVARSGPTTLDRPVRSPALSV